jgi:kumamolisin
MMYGLKRSLQMNENTSSPRVSLAGSERQALPNAQALEPVNPDELIQASIYLRKKNQDHLDQVIQQQVADQRQPLTREEYASTYGADPADVQAIEDFAHQQHLSVVEVNLARGVVLVKGTSAAMSAAFGANLQRYELQGTTYRGRSGPLSIPAHLQGIVTAVLGIDDRPQVQPLLKRPSAAAAGVSYTPLQVAHLYDFPMTSKGTGQTIALIELGGGYRDTDITKYFQQLGLIAPKVVSVPVDGAQNAPTTPDSADAEVALDIEVAGAVAPGARIVVYFAPNTDAGFLDAITTAIHDTTYTPSVISISWGGPEVFWTAQSLQAMNQAFQAAAMLGITVCCASGDQAALGYPLDFDEVLHVLFPASSPYVLACGGTKLTSANDQITQEVVWNESALSATGGGISDVFALPYWQLGKNVPPSVNPDHRVGRGVPDVAGDADPATGYQILVDGQAGVVGGTSAVAPLWAGLVALLNEQLGKPLGYLNPVLYQLENVGAFHDITEGDNFILKGDDRSGYSARPGWDACTGLGTPNGTKILSVLSDLSALSRRPKIG